MATPDGKKPKEEEEEEVRVMHICQDIKMHVSYNLALSITQRNPEHSGDAPICGGTI